MKISVGEHGVRLPYNRQFQFSGLIKIWELSRDETVCYDFILDMVKLQFLKLSLLVAVWKKLFVNHLSEKDRWQKCLIQFTQV